MTKVVIAEDSTVIQRMLTMVLAKDKTIEIIGTASDGVDTVEKVKSLRPDIVLMDYRMPKQNAPEAIKQIMSHTPTAILVVTSAEPAEEKRREVMELGAVGFMEKPKAMDYDGIAMKLLTQVKTLSKIRPSARKY